MGEVTANVSISPVSDLTGQRIYIEDIFPAVDAGRFPVKRIAGEAVDVWADIFRDGHAVIAADLLWRAESAVKWSRTGMRLYGNDRWTGSFTPPRAGRYVYAIEAWTDAFATWRQDFLAKRNAGQDMTLELLEGRQLLARLKPRSKADAFIISEACRETEGNDDPAPLLSAELLAATARAQQADLTRSATFPLTADRPLARAGAWYEMVPRSQGIVPGRHGTFDDCIARLPDIAALGFDVLYLTPIHPIGKTHRKGRDNSLTAAPGDPGSPYAVGSEQGGHDAVHPELGGIEAFRRLRSAAEDHGIELALDFAVQFSPDHPWLQAHPGWFSWRPDGSLRYAENPPKKYEDISPPDFYAEQAKPSLWLALRDVIEYWIGEGVKIFRVDNPHTKPLPFWEWLIADIRLRHPETIFLSEAFTRPAMMNRLAKLGFTQSYTYFTWRNTKAELTEYMVQLTREAPKDFYRPNFFVNTPDINPYFLHTSGRPGFLIRAALATTLSGLWGMYSGFEVCEAAPLVGPKGAKEEYLDAEKYEIRVRDWHAPGNIVAEISRLNFIRKENPALHTHLGVRFHTFQNDQVLYFAKSTLDLSNFLLIAISLDPHHAQEGHFEVPLHEFGLPDHGALDVEELARGGRFTWHGKWQHWRFVPNELPYAIWRVRPKA